jgi:uncharacterized protein (TIGR02246 family)
MNQQSAETEIRTLIEKWAKAVQSQDLEAVIAHRTSDMLMFDVPPPNELRGLETYRNSWAPFFEHFKNSGIFEIEKLDVTAGTDIAYATALLRCGTEEELAKEPDNRLRLTVCLRQENGQWMIAHEHHSFPAEG